MSNYLKNPNTLSMTVTSKKSKWTAEKLDNIVVAPKPMSEAEEEIITKKLVKASVNMLIATPFMGYLLSRFEFKVDYTCQTAATDGEFFFYNPYFIASLSDGEVIFILMHELAHAFLKHVTRRGTRDPEKWNYACDYCVHSLIMAYLTSCSAGISNSSKQRRLNSIKFPKNCLYNSKYDNLSAEEIYALLPKDYKSQAAFKAGSSGLSSNSRDNDQQGQNDQDDDFTSKHQGLSRSQTQTPLDDHSKWYEAKAQQDVSRKEREWASRLVAAQIASEGKDAGSQSGYLARLINKLKSPKKDWRLLLQEYLQLDIKQYTWMKPDNRYTEEEFGDIKLPGFFDEDYSCSGIVFAVDCSGSMSDEDIRNVYSEIVGAAHMMNISGYLCFWDTKCSDLISFDDIDDIINVKQTNGLFGGGTDPSCVFKKVEEELQDNDYHVITFMSDGYFSFPDEKEANGKPVIWVICNKDESVKVPWGKEVRMDPSEYE